MGGRRDLTAELASLVWGVLAHEREAIAERVAELVRTDEKPDGLVDAAEVARRVGRSRDWVYAHRHELGVVPLGKGPRPRLGFTRAKVAAYLDVCSSGRRTQEPTNAGAKRSMRRTPRGANGQGARL